MEECQNNFECRNFNGKCIDNFCICENEEVIIGGKCNQSSTTISKTIIVIISILSISSLMLLGYCVGDYLFRRQRQILV